MKDKPQPELDLNVKFVPPKIAQVLEEALKIELPKEEAAMFHLHYQTNGWMAGRVKMKSWKDGLLMWKMRWLKSRAPEHRSIWEISKIIEAKKGIAEGIRHRHFNLVAGGGQWDSIDARERYRQMQTEIRTLTARLAGME